MGSKTLAQRILISTATEIGGADVLARYLKVARLKS
jgi:hypothetical protein